MTYGHIGCTPPPPPPLLYIDMLGHIPDMSLTYRFFFKSFQLDHANLDILGANLGILGIFFRT